MPYDPVRANDPQEVEFYGSYFSIPASACESYYYTPSASLEMDIYVVAFNNPFLVEYQIATLCRFCHTPFNLIVVDNNNGLHPESSRKMLELCIREGITYIKAPDNLYQSKERFDPTMKLGTTMNWIYVQCVLERRPKYFGYLDQDCFLVKDFDLRDYLDSHGAYGKVVRSKVDAAWTLHVTATFYKLDFVWGHLLDFRASYPHQLDTGGANYDVLFKNYPAEDYELEYHSFRFAEQDVNRKDSVQHYETIDNGNWYHMCASSHDQLAGDGAYKLAYTKGYLDSRLQP